MGFPAATVTSATMHGPPILGVGCPTVLIGGMPAWRLGDVHTCPMMNAPPPAGPGTPHGPGSPTVPCSFTVFIGGMPAARQTDQIIEAGAVVPPLVTNVIMMGYPTVLIG
jgi:uncharacterized Zn-binding protein involved in type VI secretion